MRLFLLLLFALAVPPAAAQPAETVRVRLFAASPPSSATFTSSTAIEVQLDNGGTETLRAGVTLRARASRGRLSVRGLDGSVREVLVLRSDAPIRVASGSRSQSYAGDIWVRAENGRLHIVNHVDMQSYVASVVASEYPFRALEGIKAQAILARTYATRRLDPSGDYDVGDHQGDQVYKGVEIVTERAQRAAVETAGERLYFGSELAEAVYSSSSGGHTADNETIWNGRPLPYLRGVPDPYDADAPDYRWRTTASVKRVHDALSRQHGGRVRAVSVSERSPEGRARTIELAGARTITGSQFRATVNAALGFRTVRSTHVDISRQGNTYVFTGRGFGHGVGMSQYGADGQARQGRSYEQILAHYFQGTSVRQDPNIAAMPIATGAPRWPTSRAEARRTASSPEEATAPTTVRRRPTPRREARARPPAPARRGW